MARNPLQPNDNSLVHPLAPEWWPGQNGTADALAQHLAMLRDWFRAPTRQLPAYPQDAGQYVTMPSPDVSLMQPGSMPTTAQMAAQPVSQYVNPATGAFTPEGMQRARDVTDTAMAMGGVGPSGGGFRAYHGSPHAFDQFDLSKIGTGEGAQAYGHGMYLADAEGVARNYRDNLSGKQSGVMVNGTPAEQVGLSPGAMQMAQMHLDGTSSLDALRASNEASLAKAQAGLEKYPNSQVNQMNADMAQRSLAALDELKGKDITFQPNPGHMYEVQVNADPAHFLDWDRPLSEQHPVVQNAVMPYLKEAAAFEQTPIDPNMKGEHIYRALSVGTPEWASGGNLSAGAARTLQEAGIPGIRYLDAGSRGAGEGSSNTVVFSPEIMDIIRRYGLAGLMAGGGAAAGLQTPSGGDQP